MKMKEKKTEEVVEEVVETPKISDELKDYLEFARFCVYQESVFDKCKNWETEKDLMLEQLGFDVSKPVSIVTGFSKDSIAKEYDEFIQSWIDRYNELDLTKIDNYTKSVLDHFRPNPWDVLFTKERLKKCAQHTTEE